MKFDSIRGDLSDFLKLCSHVVIKLGTNILTPHIERNDYPYFLQLAEQIRKIKDAKKHVLLVSSGAVGFGKKINPEFSSLPNKKMTLSQKQAFASLGQSYLIDTYRENFQRVGLEAAQILVSTSDFLNHSHYQNLKRTLDQLLEWGNVPVINENDAVAIDGLKFGDNDTLSAFISGMYPQACLIILTTVDGFYRDGEKIDLITSITSGDYKHAGAPKDGGIGGMKTKLHAAQKLLMSAQTMNISLGDKPEILEEILLGKRVGTWFFPESAGVLNSKKRWLLHHMHISGKITVDNGASEAIRNKGASLLPVGIAKVTGTFEKGQVVEVIDSNSDLIARGIISLNSTDVCSSLKTQSGVKNTNIIHRDNMVIIKKSDK